MIQNAQALLKYAKSCNININVEKKKLKIRAPKGLLSPEFKRCLIEHKQSLIFLISHYGFSQEELQRAAGEDWPDIKDNDKAIFALADALYKQRLIEQGKVPPSYTATAICASCGLVAIPPAFKGNGYIYSCPWCWVRKKPQS